MFSSPVVSVALLGRESSERAAGAERTEAGPGAADGGPRCRGPAGRERPAGPTAETPNRTALSQGGEPAGEFTGSEP